MWCTVYYMQITSLVMFLYQFQRYMDSGLFRHQITYEATTLNHFQHLNLVLFGSSLCVAILPSLPLNSLMQKLAMGPGRGWHYSNRFSILFDTNNPEALQQAPYSGC